MFVDFVVNNVGHGPVGSRLGEVMFDPGMLRPYINDRGTFCCNVMTGRLTKDGRPERKEVPVAVLRQRGYNVPTTNATTLRKDQWIEVDRVVVESARQRLTAWTQLMAAASVGGFNGMGKLTYEYEAMSEAGEALVDMEGISPGRTDAPKTVLRSLPLPITHSDFWFSARRIAASRNGGTPLDTTMASMAARRVAEMIEKTLTGVETGINYGPSSSSDSRYDGSSKVYGYTNFPSRTTKTNMTVPTGANPEATVTDVIAMRELAYANGFYGPFVLYTSPAWDAFLDNDYFRSGSTAAQRTLRERIESIRGIQRVERLDYMPSGYHMVLVQMSPDIARAINAMDITTVMWEEQGGMLVKFKVMCIMVPQLRATYAGTTGIVHGTTP